MAAGSRRRIQGLLPGLIIVVLGVLLTLHNLSIVPLGGLRRFWPLILVAFGVSKLLDPAKRGHMFGWLLVAGGAALQVSNLGWFHFTWHSLMNFWPLILVAVGVHLLAGPRRRDNLAAGLILLFLGVGFQLQNLQLIRFDLWRLWPVIIIVIGVAMMQKALRPRLRFD